MNGISAAVSQSTVGGYLSTKQKGKKKKNEKES
jgi:hypothetical protein